MHGFTAGMKIIGDIAASVAADMTPAPIETNHAYAELGGLLKERFGILLTNDQCKSLVEEARGMTIRWQAYGGHSGQPDREVA